MQTTKNDGLCGMFPISNNNTRKIEKIHMQLSEMSKVNNDTYDTDAQGHCQKKFANISDCQIWIIVLHHSLM